jgi:integrase
LLPQFVIDVLPTDGMIVTISPDIITQRHRATLKKLSLPLFRFHDLRHYSASILHALGIPDQYIMQRGGWSSDETLKRVYRGTIDTYEEKFNQTAMTHFEKMQHDLQHD